jgi:hypothetical protein
MLYKDIREKETKINAQVFLNIYIIILNKDKNIQRIFSFYSWFIIKV